MRTIARVIFLIGVCTTILAAGDALATVENHNSSRSNKAQITAGGSGTGRGSDVLVGYNAVVISTQQGSNIAAKLSDLPAAQVTELRVRTLLRELGITGIGAVEVERQNNSVTVLLLRNAADDSVARSQLKLPARAASGSK